MFYELWLFSKKGNKSSICFPGRRWSILKAKNLQILSFKNGPLLGRKAKIKMEELLPLNVYSFTFTLLHSERPEIVCNFGLSECNRVKFGKNSDFDSTIFDTSCNIHLRPNQL